MKFCNHVKDEEYSQIRVNKTKVLGESLAGRVRCELLQLADEGGAEQLQREVIVPISKR